MPADATSHSIVRPFAYIHPSTTSVASVQDSSAQIVAAPPEHRSRTHGRARLNQLRTSPAQIFGLIGAKETARLIQQIAPL